MYEETIIFKTKIHRNEDGSFYRTISIILKENDNEIVSDAPSLAEAIERFDYICL